MAQIKIEEVDILPLCPHCEEELDRILKISKGILFVTVVYICPHCKRVLSCGYGGRLSA